MQIGNGKCKDTMVVAVQQSDAVRANQGSPVLFAGIEDALFEFGTCLRLLTESGRDDDKGAHPFLSTEEIDVVRAVLSCHHEYGEIRLGNILHVVDGLDALYLVFLGIHDVQGTLEASTDNIAHNGTTWLVHIVRAANDDDALRF